MSNPKNATEKTSKRIAAVAMLALMVAAAAAALAGTSNMQTAEAAMISQSLTTHALKDTAKVIQLVGTANYPTFQYEITKWPVNGKITAFDKLTGKVTYQPNAGFVGHDSLTYKIVSKINAAWYSNTATIKIAVVEPWKQFVNSPYSPVDLSRYLKDKQLSPATMPEIIGTTNIEPMKATPYGKMAYTNSKIAIELTGQSWWSFSLGQKAWIMDQYGNLLNKMFIQGYVAAP